MNTSEQKTVVIGGISGGIGSALAEQLCRTGDRVVGFARNTQGLEALRARHPEIEVHSCDATDSRSAQQLLRADHRNPRPNRCLCTCDRFDFPQARPPHLDRGLAPHRSD